MKFESFFVYSYSIYKCTISTVQVSKYCLSIISGNFKLRPGDERNTRKPNVMSSSVLSFCPSAKNNIHFFSEPCYTFTVMFF